MGMISETIAERQAQDYEKILLAAIDEYLSDDAFNDNENSGGAILGFCKEHIYPRYQFELGDAWRTERTIEQIKIENFFEKH